MQQRTRLCALLSVMLAGVMPLGACSHAPSPPPSTAAGDSAPKGSPAGSAPMAAMSAAPATLDDWARGAQLFADLGDYHRKVSSDSVEAQQFFDQGMRLMWAFNHDEATRSFARAAQLDPHCGICFWGVALTVGPNYNMPMMAEARAQVAFDSLQRAEAQLERADPSERALIGALHARYPQPTALDPSNEGPVLRAYANAMRDAARRFPADPDIQTMYAESLMNINAWKLWTADGKPAPGTLEIVHTLERVLARDPTHPGANHYYVHAIEASPHPDKAVAAAERLRGMMPAAGHLEHMPAHIFQRVGRYEDAAEANRRGAAADAAYLSKVQPLGYYSMYVAHNYQFLGYSAAMEGRESETLSAVRQMLSGFSEDAMLAMPGTDWAGAELYLAMMRFGLWDQILAEPRPNPALKALTGGYLFARTTALAATARLEEARAALAELDQLRGSLPPGATAGFNPAADVLSVASLIARSRIEAAEQKRAAAIASLTQAVAQEDRLMYDEPADWFFPVRHLLGAELVRAGQNAQAEAVYREDLRRNPHNGWALFGLAQALRAQNRTADAAAVETQFHDAWKHSDLTLTASAL